jgi:uncharacterized membrane protein
VRVVRIALVLSVALNLLFIGAVVGAWLDRGPDRDPRLRSVGPIAPFAAAMRVDDRRAFVDDLRREAGEGRPSHSEQRARFDALVDAIGQEPFDRVRLEAVFTDQRTAAVERQRIGEGLLIDRIAEMSVEERTAYAERLQDVIRGSRRR